MENDIVVIDQPDRLEGESDIDYQQFLVYASIEPAQRTVNNAWQAWSGKDTVAGGAFRKKASENRWLERAAMHDTVLMKQSQDHWVVRDQERRNKDYRLGDLMTDLAMEKLESIQDMAENLTIQQALRFANSGARLKAAAMPDVQLDKNEIENLLGALPRAKRGEVVRLLLLEHRKKA